MHREFVLQRVAWDWRQVATHYLVSLGIVFVLLLFVYAAGELVLSVCLVHVEKATKIVATATIRDIEDLLRLLGGGNYCDNMQTLRAFKSYLFIELARSDFLGLVFLQNEEVASICPMGQDRTIRAVALRAMHLTTNPVLSGNWDVSRLSRRAVETMAAGSLRPLVLRDASDSERSHGPWYIQDGAHTALGYAMALLERLAEYTPVRAYCATNTALARMDRPAV